jgi:hypothetical protein
MTTIAIRQKLMTYIADADEKKIRGLYLLMEEDIKANESFQLSEEEIKFLRNERQEHLDGKTKSYSWKEAKELIRSNKKF